MLGQHFEYSEFVGGDHYLLTLILSMPNVYATERRDIKQLLDNLHVDARLLSE